jgi:hypothetical protein
MRSATSAVSAGARRRAQAITETSHIYAESSAAGELKHGPITLIDEIMHIDGRPIRPNPCKHAGSWQPAASTILLSDAKGRRGPEGQQLVTRKLPTMPAGDCGAAGLYRPGAAQPSSWTSKARWHSTVRKQTDCYTAVTAGKGRTVIQR